MTTVLGVDACPGGWVGVELYDGRFASAHVGTRLNELIGKVPDAVIIGVDMPLDSGERDADRVVKRARPAVFQPLRDAATACIRRT